MDLRTLATALLLSILLTLTVAFLGAFWLPLLGLLLVVGVSLWVIRRYHLDYLDDPAEDRTNDQGRG